MFSPITRGVRCAKDACFNCVKYSVPQNATVFSLSAAAGWYAKRFTEAHGPEWSNYFVLQQDARWLGTGTFARVFSYWVTQPFVTPAVNPRMVALAAVVAAYAVIVIGNLVSRYFTSELQQEPLKTLPPPTQIATLTSARG